MSSGTDDCDCSRVKIDLNTMRNAYVACAAAMLSLGQSSVEVSSVRLNFGEDLGFWNVDTTPQSPWDIRVHRMGVEDGRAEILAWLPAFPEDPKHESEKQGVLAVYIV